MKMSYVGSLENKQLAVVSTISLAIKVPPHIINFPICWDDWGLLKKLRIVKYGCLLGSALVPPVNRGSKFHSSFVDDATALPSSLGVLGRIEVVAEIAFPAKRRRKHNNRIRLPSLMVFRRVAGRGIVLFRTVDEFL